MNSFNDVWSAIRPQASAPYVNIGCIWQSKSLKKSFGQFSPSVHKSLSMPKTPFLALLAISVSAYEKVRPVEKTTPRYLYWFTTSSLIPSYSHFSLAATCPPFLKRERERERERQTDRQTDRQGGRQTGKKGGRDCACVRACYRVTRCVYQK